MPNFEFPADKPTNKPEIKKSSIDFKEILEKLDKDAAGKDEQARVAKIVHKDAEAEKHHDESMRLFGISQEINDLKLDKEIDPIKRIGDEIVAVENHIQDQEQKGKRVRPSYRERLINLEETLKFVQAKIDEAELNKNEEKGSNQIPIESSDKQEDIRKRSIIDQQQSQRRAVEMKETILLDEISKYGGVWCSADVDRERAQQFNHSGRGFCTLADDKLDRSWTAILSNKVGFASSTFSNKYKNDYDREKDFYSKGINEGIAIKPITESEYDEVIIQPERKKLFGGVVPAKKERKYVGEKPINFRDAVKTDNKYQKEKAYSFVYKTFDDEKSKYITSDGRSGQYLLMEVVIPESLAKELSTALEKDPKLARKMVEKFILQNLKIDKDYWQSGGKDARAPLRPPYEAWNNEKKDKGGSKILFRDINGNDRIL